MHAPTPIYETFSQVEFPRTLRNLGRGSCSLRRKSVDILGTNIRVMIVIGENEKTGTYANIE